MTQEHTELAVAFAKEVMGWEDAHATFEDGKLTVNSYHDGAWLFEPDNLNHVIGYSRDFLAKNKLWLEIDLFSMENRVVCDHLEYSERLSFFEGKDLAICIMQATLEAARKMGE